MTGLPLRAAIAAILLIAAPTLGAAQMSDADTVVRLEQLENQVRQLTGNVEQLQFRNQQLEQNLRKLQDDYEFRFQELSGKGGGRPGGASAQLPPAPPPSGPPVASPTPVGAPPPGRRSDAFDPNQNPNAPGAPRALGGGSGAPYVEANQPPPGGGQGGAPLDLSGGNQMATLPPSQTPQDEFDLGFGYMQRRDYALAEQTFRGFLKKYPDDPRLAGEAQFWLGESLFQRKNYRDAADAFLVITKKFATSPKAPDSLLRLGQSLAALNEKDLACGTFGEVKRKYPRASQSVKQAIERESQRVHC